LFWDIDIALIFATNFPSKTIIKPVEGEKRWSNLLNHEFPLL
jgi:hypothetical protein